MTQVTVTERDAMVLPTVEEALGPPNVECPECLGWGWTCEQHPGEPWSGMVGNERGCVPDCAGPGDPCRCRHRRRLGGMVVTADRMLEAAAPGERTPAEQESEP